MAAVEKMPGLPGENLQDEYMRLQIEQARLNISRAKKEQDRENEQKEQMIAFKRMNAEAAAKDRAGIIAAQAACMHIKPSMRTALAGQRDHHRDEHFICAYCAKEFTSQETPQHLRPDPQLVGGPI